MGDIMYEGRKVTLVAIDPGPHTGVAVKIPTAVGGVTDYHTMMYEMAEQPNLWELLRNLEGKHALVAYEVFRRSERIDNNMRITMETVGGIQAAAYICRLKLYAHSPQIKVPMDQPAANMLKDRGIKRAPDTEHEIDALAHLLAFEYRAQKGLVKLPAGYEIK